MGHSDRQHVARANRRLPQGLDESAHRKTAAVSRRILWRRPRRLPTFRLRRLQVLRHAQEGEALL